MRFKVPQFLEIEDKIFGPLSFKEFVYAVGGAGMCFVIYKALDFWLGIIPITIVAGLSLALVFVRPNNRPFVDTLQASLMYLIRSKLYIWQQKRKQEIGAQAKVEEKTKGASEPKLTGSKLHDLSWGLDILDLKKNSKK